MTNNFDIIFEQSNPLWGAFLEVNQATNGLLGSMILITIFIVSTYVFMRRTQDITKSLLSSLHITTIMALILFYAFKMSVTTATTPLVSEIVMLSLIMGEVISIAVIYFTRSKGS